MNEDVGVRQPPLDLLLQVLAQSMGVEQSHLAIDDQVKVDEALCP